MTKETLAQLNARIVEKYADPVPASHINEKCRYCVGGSILLAALDCGFLTLADLDLQDDEDEDLRFPDAGMLAMGLARLNPTLDDVAALNDAMDITDLNDDNAYLEAFDVARGALLEPYWRHAHESTP